MKLVVRNEGTAVAGNDTIDIPHNARRGGKHKGDRHAQQDRESPREHAVREDRQRRGTGVATARRRETGAFSHGSAWKCHVRLEDTE